MLMGDDHVFPPHMVIKLLALMYKHDLDIIVPLCFKRSFPPAPVLYDLGSDNLPYHVDLSDHPQGGLIEVYCAGTAGMIIRKRVIDTMKEKGDIPYFQLGGEHWGEDLDFCRRARTHGFKVHADLDMPLGHIVNTTLWPARQPGGWGCDYEFNQQGGFFLGL
jgi:GT2 family glycosyltransferase